MMMTQHWSLACVRWACVKQPRHLLTAGSTQHQPGLQRSAGTWPHACSSCSRSQPKAMLPQAATSALIRRLQADLIWAVSAAGDSWQQRRSAAAAGG